MTGELCAGEPLEFKKSTRSVEVNCVEIARAASNVFVRDSKHRAGPVLSFPSTAFARFLDAARGGEFEH